MNEKQAKAIKNIKNELTRVMTFSALKPDKITDTNMHIPLAEAVRLSAATLVKVSNRLVGNVEISDIETAMLDEAKLENSDVETITTENVQTDKPDSTYSFEIELNITPYLQWVGIALTTVVLFDIIVSLV